MSYTVERRASLRQAQGRLLPVVSAGHRASIPRYHFPMPDVDWIRQLCLSFPDVTEDMPWGDDLCFKVRGKIFTGVVLSDGRFPRVTLKCAPEKFHELLEIEGISPAPYVGRYKWAMLGNSNVLPAAELEALIRQSYDLVASRAPKKKAERKKAPSKRRAK
jgi:predicted DNA-binding protein (MmcQ/YjbR family)